MMAATMKEPAGPFNPGDFLVQPEGLSPGEARLIEVESEDRPESVILMRTEAGFRAYYNRCRHLPISLDWGDGDVLDESGRLFLCRNHGALFRVTDGLCTAGPCRGEKLIQLALDVREDGVYLGTEQAIWL